MAKGLSAESITVAATELIEQYGRSGFSMRLLADTMGVKTASLYNHIENMDTLLTEVCRYALRMQEDGELRAIAGKTGREAVWALAWAYRRFAQNPPEDYRRFCEENGHWLPDYALFMALKDAHGGRPWNEWEQPLKTREPGAIAAAREQYAGEIGFQMMLQYLFTRQWRALKGYANERGIRIIGDIPIYVPRDSADVWSAPEQFLLDENFLRQERCTGIELL